MDDRFGHGMRLLARFGLHEREWRNGEKSHHQTGQTRIKTVAKRQLVGRACAALRRSKYGSRRRIPSDSCVISADILDRASESSKACGGPTYMPANRRKSSSASFGPDSANAASV